MTYFDSEDEVYEFIGRVFCDLLDDPELGPKLKRANTIVQYQYHHPEAVVTIRLMEGKKGQVDMGPTKLEPEVIMSMDADTAHKFWLGKVNVTVALARGQMKAKGPVAKILKLVPLVKPAFPLYRERLKAAGRTDLASVA
jgi:putative sterol carrier protein